MSNLSLTPISTWMQRPRRAVTEKPAIPMIKTSLYPHESKKFSPESSDFIGATFVRYFDGERTANPSSPIGTSFNNEEGRIQKEHITSIILNAQKYPSDNEERLNQIKVFIFSMLQRGLNHKEIRDNLNVLERELKQNNISSIEVTDELIKKIEKEFAEHDQTHIFLEQNIDPKIMNEFRREIDQKVHEESSHKTTDFFHNSVVFPLSSTRNCLGDAINAYSDSSNSPVSVGVSWGRGENSHNIEEIIKAFEELDMALPQSLLNLFIKSIYPFLQDEDNSQPTLKQFSPKNKDGDPLRGYELYKAIPNEGEYILFFLPRTEKNGGISGRNTDKAPNPRNLTSKVNIETIPYHVATKINGNLVHTMGRSFTTWEGSFSNLELLYQKAFKKKGQLCLAFKIE